MMMMMMMMMMMREREREGPKRKTNDSGHELSYDMIHNRLILLELFYFLFSHQYSVAGKEYFRRGRLRVQGRSTVP